MSIYYKLIWSAGKKPIGSYARKTENNYYEFFVIRDSLKVDIVQIISSRNLYKTISDNFK